jgi:hypothetical protein
MEVADPLGGELERGSIRPGKATRSGRKLSWLDLKALVVCRRPAVESHAELAQGGIAFGANPCADLRDRRTLGRELRKIEPPS